MVHKSGSSNEKESRLTCLAYAVPEQSASKRSALVTMPIGRRCTVIKRASNVMSLSRDYKMNYTSLISQSAHASGQALGEKFAIPPPPGAINGNFSIVALNAKVISIRDMLVYIF